MPTAFLLPRARALLPTVTDAFLTGLCTRQHGGMQVFLFGGGGRSILGSEDASRPERAGGAGRRD